MVSSESPAGFSRTPHRVGYLHPVAGLERTHVGQNQTGQHMLTAELEPSEAATRKIDTPWKASELPPAVRKTTTKRKDYISRINW